MNYSKPNEKSIQHSSLFMHDFKHKFLIIGITLERREDLSLKELLKTLITI